MLGALRGVSPASETMSEETLERNRAEKALITKTPTHSQYKSGVKNYSDKNGNDVTKAVHRGRKTFAFWTLVSLLLVLAVGNLVLTFTIFAVLRLGHGLESMEFLPAERALKMFGRAELQHVYKRDGRVDSFRGEPLALSSQGGAVLFTLQTRARADPRLEVNASGVFLRGVGALELRDPATGEVVLTTPGGRGSAGGGGGGGGAAQCTVPDAVNNLHARLISTHRVSAPLDEDLVLHSDSSTFLRGAEGTRMESKELFWSADQDIHIRSINGSIVLSGKEGVYLDVRYLPIAAAGPAGPAGAPAGQFKVCVCMPQGKLFKIAVPSGQRVSCSHINMAGELNPCL